MIGLNWKSSKIWRRVGVKLILPYRILSWRSPTNVAQAQKSKELLGLIPGKKKWLKVKGLLTKIIVIITEEPVHGVSYNVILKTNGFFYVPDVKKRKSWEKFIGAEFVYLYNAKVSTQTLHVNAVLLFCNRVLHAEKQTL